MRKKNDLGLLLLRLTISGLMLFHGVAKFGKLDGIKNMLSEVGLPEFMSYGVFVTELIAPLLILVGFRTKLASLVFCFGMIAALFLAHSDNLFELSKTGGLAIELILLYAFGALALFFTGGGKYAISNSNKWD